MKTIYFAGGCFWGIQKFFDQFDGIISTTVGYANGEKRNPSYEEVCSDSGHAETVKVVYDESVMSTMELLRLFFMVIDPTSVNRQGGDSGIQYRTGIYYEDGSLLPEILDIMKEEQEKYDLPIVVEVKPLWNFFTAEEYHQKYLDKNPGGYCHISPELIMNPGDGVKGSFFLK
ncbi:MAG: peptide-methionine (S)-S-oxide reductase MsrA [Anaerolineaceae bacterium]|nr:peptide-methionine (S)-S-oxide reductase MsrA [Anaerolineaceae bacterium]MBQ6344477.1 peptide-methionine (S)-S-oxide reductase MsrA [Anaerolineaceae bacterium]